MPKNYLSLILIATLASLCNAQEDRTKALEVKLASTVEEYSVNAEDPLNALLEVAADFQLPIGIQWIRNMGKPVSRSWEQTTISGLLSDIAAAGGKYHIDVNNGVVHIGPAGLMGTENDVLDLKLDSFEVSNRYVRFALVNLRQRVQPLMVPEHVVKGGYAGSVPTGAGDRPVTLKLTNPTVRDVLDALCLAADLKVWLVGYTSSPTKTSAGFLRTASRWEEKASEVSDFSQPFIDMQTWGTPVGPRTIFKLPQPNKMPIKDAPSSPKPGYAQ